MNEKQWKRLRACFDVLYDVSEKVDDMNEEIGDPQIDKAMKQIIDGLDIIANMLIAHEEAGKADV